MWPTAKMRSVAGRGAGSGGLCLGLGACLAPAHAIAAEYYVSASGSDAAAGSSGAPFATIARGVAAVKAATR